MSFFQAVLVWQRKPQRGGENPSTVMQGRLFVLTKQFVGISEREALKGTVLNPSSSRTGENSP